jgi:methylthioribose-1-phosphate isomerase
VSQSIPSVTDQSREEAAVPSLAAGLPRAVWWDSAAGALHLLDQTLLPARCETVTCDDVAEVAEAIRRLRVRGAPAIGIAAAYGLVLATRAALRADPAIASERLWASLTAAAAELRATRPTAVNLAWALERLQTVAERSLAAGEPPARLPERLLAEAEAIAAEDASACLAMGELGAELIADGDRLLTHCNAGALATGGMGTALAPIYRAWQRGTRLHVFVDETRPVLQGARLTAWELSRAGVPLTLISDNMAAHVMRTRAISAVFVGADRIAANGDVANKIGTYGLAILAREHGIPFYVVAPRSTVDLALPSGDAIPIEERAADEVTHVFGLAIAPAGVPAYNPAFDVTPARFVSAIITEAGVARAPYEHSLAQLMGQPAKRTP